MATPAPTAGTVRLADGRRLGYSEHGDRDGRAVLYLHGAIGSPVRLSAELAGVVARLGLRWICVQRPGFGVSDERPGRSILDFAADVSDLLDALRIRRAAVVGVSAGGPYALACGHALADRVGAVALCSSLSPLCAPHAVPGLRRRIRVPLRALARHPRACVRALDTAAAVARRHPDVLVRVMAVGAPSTDRRLVADAEAGRTAVCSLLDAVAGGVGGAVEDYIVSCRPWGFAPAEVRVPVDLWHGAQDHIVPVEHAWQLAAGLPTCRAAFDPSEGHFFFRRRVGEIVGGLVDAATLPAG